MWTKRHSADHMGICTDVASWGQPQPALLEAWNVLALKGATHPVDGYRALCVRCLGDGSFANKLAQRQRPKALASCVPSKYWPMILRVFNIWLHASGRSTRLGRRGQAAEWLSCDAMRAKRACARAGTVR